MIEKTRKEKKNIVKKTHLVKSRIKTESKLLAGVVTEAKSRSPDTQSTVVKRQTKRLQKRALNGHNVLTSDHHK